MILHQVWNKIFISSITDYLLEFQISIANSVSTDAANQWALFSNQPSDGSVLCAVEDQTRGGHEIAKATTDSRSLAPIIMITKSKIWNHNLTRNENSPTKMKPFSPT